MKTVKIAELKSRLSQHLRDVRAGASLAVLDRTVPIAKLVPIDQGDDAWVTRPQTGSPPVGHVKLPRQVKIDADVVRLLLDERQRR